MEQLRPTGRINMKLMFRVFFENLSRKIKFPEYLARISGAEHEDPPFMVTSRGILFRMRNVLCKFVEGIKTHFVLNIFPHPPP
jgi:hypothetical protein